MIAAVARCSQQRVSEYELGLQISNLILMLAASDMHLPVRIPSRYGYFTGLAHIFFEVLQFLRPVIEVVQRPSRGSALYPG